MFYNMSVENAVSTKRLTQDEEKKIKNDLPE